MSERKHPDGRQRLPLPSPRPGAAQDEKILAYARAHAPRRAPSRPGPWVAGMAMAGIVGVAVMITLPQQSPSPMVETPAARSHEAPEATAPAASAAKISRLEMASEALQDAAPGTAYSPPTAAADAVAKGDGADGDEPAAGELVNFAGTATEIPDSSVSADDLGKHLERLRALQRSGDGARASAEYQWLRNHCADCRLPETLEQALVRYPPAKRSKE